MNRYGIVRRCRDHVLLCTFVLLLTCKVCAQTPPSTSSNAVADDAAASKSIACLPDGTGFLRARLRGSIDSELDWGNDTTDCTGAVRPTDGGIRMKFTGPVKQDGGEQRLVLVFGIAGLREGTDARTVPVNVTVIREGSGEFYGTQGDDKCTLDEVKQVPLRGIPHRERSYRISARGFCTEPARAIKGSGAVLISRFDFAGRVDFGTEESDNDPLVPITHIR